MVIVWFMDLCVRDVRRSRDVSVALLGFDVPVDHGWYVELGVDARVVLALVEVDHETGPSVAGAPHP